MPGPDNVLQNMLQNILEQNPNIRNNPNAQPIINALMNNDARTGEQLARNYCQSLGMDWNQAVQSAKAFLGLP